MKTIWALMAVVSIVVAACAAVWQRSSPILLTVSMLVSALVLVVLAVRFWRVTTPDRAGALLDQSEKARNILTQYLSAAIVANLAAFAFVLIDSAGQTVYAMTFRNTILRMFIAAFTAISSVVPFAQWIVTLTGVNKNAGARPSVRVLAAIGDRALVLVDGLALGAMHEVLAQAGRQGVAATGFVAGLAGRVAARRPIVWIRQDFTEIEAGALSMSGLAELGLDPRLLVSIRAAGIDHALRTAADALVCDAVGVVVMEIWGEAKQFDLVASRKLTLAAQASGATCLVLRMAAEPRPSTAETRWIVRAAHSPPGSSPSSAWGAPLFDAQLVRNRHGPSGRWIMEWKCDECLFGSPAAYSQPVAAAPAHRPHRADQSVFKRKPAPDAIGGGYRFA